MPIQNLANKAVSVALILLACLVTGRDARSQHIALPIPQVQGGKAGHFKELAKYEFKVTKPGPYLLSPGYFLVKLRGSNPPCVQVHVLSAKVTIAGETVLASDGPGWLRSLSAGYSKNLDQPRVRWLEKASYEASFEVEGDVSRVCKYNSSWYGKAVNFGFDYSPESNREKYAEQPCGDGDAQSRPSEEDNVFFNNGEERLDRVDLVIPGKGEIHFEMRRRYRSSIYYPGPLGYNWDFTYNERLSFDPSGDIWRENGLSRRDAWKRVIPGVWSPPSGYHGKLIANGDGTYTLREFNGFKRNYNKEGLLSSYEDRFGNKQVFIHKKVSLSTSKSTWVLDQVIDVYGRIIQFSYDRVVIGNLGPVVWRLKSVRDFTGREIRYSYDKHHNLVAVRTPLVTNASNGNDFPLGRTENYYYLGGDDRRLAHKITGVVRPADASKQIPYLTWKYGTNPKDLLTFGKVIEQWKGGTNASGVAAGGTTKIRYSASNPKAVVTDRNGNVTEYSYNTLWQAVKERRLTRGLRKGDPAVYETTTSYTPDGLITRRTYPEGNRVSYLYDSRPSACHLVRLITRDPGPRGGGEPIHTQFEYEPLYNQLRLVIGPRGMSGSFKPPIGKRSKARYTTERFFDYQEHSADIAEAKRFGIDITGIRRGLGDLNGDGRTNRSFGNMVREVAPSVLLEPGSYEARKRNSTSQQIVKEISWRDDGRPAWAVDPEGNVTEFSYYDEKATGHSYLRSVVTDARTSKRRTSKAPPAKLETLYTYDKVGNITSMRNPRGVVTKYEVTNLNEVVVETRGADVSVAKARKQLLTGEKPYNYRIRRFYDANGRVVRTETENRDSTTSGVGAFVDETFTYDILDNLVERSREIDASSTAVWRYRYDANENQIRATQPEGNAVATTYDERDLPFRITRGAGTSLAATIQIDYDANGNRARVTDAADTDGKGGPESTLYRYDGFDRRIRVTDPLGGVELSYYDPAGNVVRTIVAGHPAGKPEDPIVRFREVNYSPDELSRVYRVDEKLFVPKGFTTSRTPQLLDYDRDGWVTTRQEYDALSRPTFAVPDDLQATEKRYDGAGRVIATIDPHGNMTLTDYDANSNPVKVGGVELQPQGLVPAETFTTHYVYDQLDRLVRATDNAGQTTRFDYDSRDNLTHRSDPVGPLTNDPLGLFPGKINSTGNTSTFDLDGLDRTVREVHDLRANGMGGQSIDTTNPTNPDGRVTVRYEFDKNSRLTKIIDDSGNQTSFAWDALDRKVQQQNDDLTRFTYTYDADDNVRKIRDPNGNQIVRTYDALNRVASVDIKHGANAVIGTTVEQYQYDGLSRLTASLDNNGGVAIVLTERVYDSLSRLIEERQDGKPVSNVFAGDGTRIKCTYPGGREIQQFYDALDRPQITIDKKGVICGSLWIGPSTRELVRICGNGTILSYLDDTLTKASGYDAVKRPVRERWYKPGFQGVFLDREYAYNRAGARTLERRHDDGKLTDSYVYDSLYRVATSSFDQQGTGRTRNVLRVDYTLDGVGNRRSVKETRKNGTSTIPYVVNGVNEYRQIENQVRQHDPNGNLRNDGSRQLFYDYKNRLVGVLTSEIAALYLYDTDNRRRHKYIVHLVGQRPPSITDYLYDGWRVCEEQNGFNDDTLITYVYGASYIDQPIQFERTAKHPKGAGRFYVHQNARFDVIAVTDSAGRVAERFRYDEFGRAYDGNGKPIQASATGIPYLWQGRRYDSETGFYYLRNRYYDPATGRFASRDPVFDPANKANSYTFAGNSPVSRVDPSGEFVPAIEAIPVILSLAAPIYEYVHAVQVRMQQACELRNHPAGSTWESVMWAQQRREFLLTAIPGVGADFGRMINRLLKAAVQEAVLSGVSRFGLGAVRGLLGRALPAVRGFASEGVDAFGRRIGTRASPFRYLLTKLRRSGRLSGVTEELAAHRQGMVERWARRAGYDPARVRYAHPGRGLGGGSFDRSAGRITIDAEAWGHSHITAEGVFYHEVGHSLDKVISPMGPAAANSPAGNFMASYLGSRIPGISPHVAGQLWRDAFERLSGAVTKKKRILPFSPWP